MFQREEAVINWRGDLKNVKVLRERLLAPFISWEVCKCNGITLKRITTAY